VNLRLSAGGGGCRSGKPPPKFKTTQRTQQTHIILGDHQRIDDIISAIPVHIGISSGETCRIQTHVRLAVSIPSKSLIHQATLFRSANELSRMGTRVDATEFDYSYVQKQSRVAAEKLSKGVHFLLKKNNIDYFEATTSISSTNTVQLSTGESLKAGKIIIATGSRPRSIPNFSIDEKDILSSTGALLLTELPESMLILGGGAEGWMIHA
jgi:hypothetical protein